MKQLPIRILAMAPYNGMHIALERLAESYPDVAMDIYTGDLEEAAAILRKIDLSVYDCILSRGGTAQLLRTITQVPVVEVALSAYDILRTISLAENYTGHYAVIGYPNVTEAVHSLCNLTKRAVTILTVNSKEEIPPALVRLREQGIEMIVGDMAPHRLAQDMGMRSLLITSGSESLSDCMEQAVRIGKSFQKVRNINFFLTRILGGEEENITVLDETGELYYSASGDIPPALLQTLQQRVPEIPQAGGYRFYQEYHGKLLRIVGQIVRIGSQPYYLFHHTGSSSPIRSGKSGVRMYSKSECESIALASFFHLSGALNDIRKKLDTIAVTKQPVVILGEIGTGKIQVAHYVYLRSRFTANPFILIDCSVVSDKTWAYLRNRYDSPLNDKGNTICFQNFETISPENGRALIEAILSTHIPFRQRLIFCYNQKAGEPLSEICTLLMRSVSCVPIALEPLRNLTEEIPSLSSIYLGSLNKELGKQIAGFEPNAMEQLQHFPWPGNYMQLKRILRELAIETETPYIQGAMVAELLRRERSLLRPVSVPPGHTETPLTLEQIIHQAIRQALEDNGGNQSAAAKQLGIGRSTLWRHLNNTEPSQKQESTQ